MEARRARRLRRLKRTLPYMTASATLLLALCIALQFASLIPLRRFSPFMGSSAKQPTSMVAKATATATGTDTPIPFSTPLPEVLPAPVGSLTCLSTTMLPTTPIPTPKASVTPTPAAPAASSVLGFHPCLYSGPDSSSTSSMLQFYLYIPRNYSPSQSYPLVLLLHGVGERIQAKLTPSQNTAKLLNQEYVDVWGPGYPAGGPSIQDRWPSFVVVPQLIEPDRWVNVLGRTGDYRLFPQPTPSLAMAMIIVQLLQKTYPNIDPTRRYITGISMGADGVWDALERWPHYFAAGVPLAGAGDPTQAGVIIHVPVWDFHSKHDNDVPLSSAYDMLRAITAKGGHPCFTLVNAPGHTIWPQVYGLTHTYTNPLYPWLFAQRLDTPSPASPACPAFLG